MKTLIIQLWQTSLNQPQLAATPFVLALAARAMDMHVEIHALGQSVELFIENDARRLQPVTPLNRPLSQYIHDALSMGVVVRLCSTAMRDRALTSLSGLVQGDIEIAGMVSMLETISQAETVSLTY